MGSRVSGLRVRACQEYNMRHDQVEMASKREEMEMKSIAETERKRE